MKLYFEDKLLYEDVNQEQIIAELKRLGSKWCDCFILDATTNGNDPFYMQITGEKYDFSLEYCIGDEADHFYVNKLSASQVENAFCAFLKGDDAYKDMFDYKPVFPKAYNRKYNPQLKGISQSPSFLQHILILFKKQL